MREVEISQNHNKILITFETEEEARLSAPAIHSIVNRMSKFNIDGKKRFINLVFGKLLGDQVVSCIGLDEAFEIAKERSVYVKDFFNI